MDLIKVTSFSDPETDPPINTVALSLDGNPFSICMEGLGSAEPKEIDVTIYRSRFHPITLSLHDINHLQALLANADLKWKQYGSEVKP